MNALRSISGRVRLQRGVVLVTALIVLVVMTILGLLSINTTTLQSKMTGNLRETNAAFQAAEAGLQAGLTYIERNFAPPMADANCAVGVAGSISTAGIVCPGCTVGGEDSDADCTRLMTVINDWTGTGFPTKGVEYDGTSKLGGNTLKQVGFNPRILIDERQVRTDMEVGATVYYYYTVSAVGTGPAGKGRSILQTTIVKRAQ